MRKITGKISAHTLEPFGKAALDIRVSEPLALGPGQFVLAHLPGSDMAIRSRFFPQRIDPDGLISDHIPGPAWLPGKSLDVIGPLGNPLTPPEQAKKWFLISLGGHPGRLLPLLATASTRSASVAVWSKTALPVMPPDVERPIEPKEVIPWADYIAVEIPGSAWPGEDHSLLTRLLDHSDAYTQVLVDVPTPCGIGGCQACAIADGRKYTLGCETGLVRPLGDLRA